jgi:hypothetical protein
VRFLRRRRRPGAPERSSLAEGVAERLLDGTLASDDTPLELGRVADVLTAARAAPQPAELAREGDARAAFAAALPTAGSTSRRPRGRGVAMMVAGALALGATASAAATGDLPAPAQDVISYGHGGTPPGQGGTAPGKQR